MHKLQKNLTNNNANNTMHALKGENYKNNKGEGVKWTINLKSSDSAEVFQMIGVYYLEVCTINYVTSILFKGMIGM